MTTEQQTSAPFSEWAILELMGHRQLAGKVSEHMIAGVQFIRIDVPSLLMSEGREFRPGFTQFYAPTAVYGITPVVEEVARAFVRARSYEPVNRWDLQLPEAKPVAAGRERRCTCGIDNLRSEAHGHDCECEVHGCAAGKLEEMAAGFTDEAQLTSGDQ